MTVVASLDTYSFAFNGFVFGGSDNPIQITSVDGLQDLPAIRNQDDNRGYSDGMFTGRDFYSNRSIVIQFQIFASATATMQETLLYSNSMYSHNRQELNHYNFNCRDTDFKE